MLHFYLEQLVMMFSLVSDGSHRERIQLMECNLEQKKAKEMKKKKSMIDTQSQNNNNFHALLHSGHKILKFIRISKSSCITFRLWTPFFTKKYFDKKFEIK